MAATPARIITFQQAETLASQGKPWTLKMQFQGIDPSNQSGWSDKFWLATGRGKDEPVEIHFGVSGTSGTLQVHDWAYVAAKVPEKERKGYRFVATPFVRVRQSTIDAYNATKGVRGAQQALPVQPSLPLIPALAPVTVTPVPPPPPAPVTSPLAPKLTSGKLDPYDRIVSVAPDPTTGNWAGFDAAGSRVMTLTRKGAQQLVQQNPAVRVAGLI